MMVQESVAPGVIVQDIAGNGSAQKIVGEGRTPASLRRKFALAQPEATECECNNLLQTAAIQRCIGLKHA